MNRVRLEARHVCAVMAGQFGRKGNITIQMSLIFYMIIIRYYLASNFRGWPDLHF